MAPSQAPSGAMRALKAALLLAAWLKVAAAKDADCKAYGCGKHYYPERDCQCNTKCKSHSNCCADYDDLCADDTSAHEDDDAPKKKKEASPDAPTTAPPAAPPLVIPVPPVPPPVTPPPTTTTPAYEPVVSKVVNFDIYRAMAASAVDLHPMEDDDVADLGGVMKYIATEIIIESQGNPLRTNRKYDIDVVTRHRFKIRNSDKLLKSDVHSLGEFGLFVTYDWGQATNTQQVDMLKEYGDFVGIQGCAFLQCDPRFPSALPYSWFSVGNWCPNLPFDKKGAKGSPNPACLKDMHNNPMNGGLCPNGFDAASFIPAVEPTGQPGCVYSYGKAETVMLDDLVGITKEDCGGVPCRNWLHFRQNCTNKELKKKFDGITGQIVPTDVCVEHDIHPKCWGDCKSADCQAIINSGNVAYLGLPFWRDRCDPRANVRRMEQVAHAFGVAGALSRHQVVDPQLAKNQCPASTGTSGQCTPIIPGQSGPFCTRSFNGACEPCYLPGTKTGPDQVPHCPLDVLANYPGYEAPKCKSKKASEGCCLYGHTCEGDSAPASATLDDDGYALVAARQNTVDMAIFMKRAVQQLEPSLASLLGDQAKVDYAAYSAWSTAPVSLKLAEAVKEFGHLLKGPTIATATTATATTTNLKVGGCFELAMSFLPLDMNNAMMTTEDGVHACQDRCARTGGCAHFTFMATPGTTSGSCHLQDLAATPMPGSPPNNVAGPYKCWNDIKDKANLIDIGHHTYVPSDLACMELGMVYLPTMLGETPQVISNPTREGAIMACQKHCAETDGCAYFHIMFPNGDCYISGKDAHTSPLVGAVAGPAVCRNKEKASFYRLFEAEADAAAEPLRSAPQSASPLLLLVVAISMVSGFGFSCAFLMGRRLRRPSRRDLGDVLILDTDQEGGLVAPE